MTIEEENASTGGEDEKEEKWEIGFDHKLIKCLKWPVPSVKDCNESEAKGRLAAYAEKLEAEDSIRTAAALIIGFSFSLITSASVKGRGDNDSCERGPPICIEPKTVYQVHLVFLVLASVCGAVSIMFTTGLSFKGQRILGKASQEERDRATTFAAFWDHPWIDFGRDRSRDLFLGSIPSFLVAIGFSPTVWCEDCNLGMGLAVVLIMCGAFSYTVCASLMTLKINKKEE